MNPEEQAPSLVVTGPTGERRIGLDQHPVVDIGRGPDNVVCLVSQSVSRRHALVRRHPDGSCTIIDLGSRNGTDVNGRRIQNEVNLSDGDRIQIGEYGIVFHAPTASAPQEIEDTGFDSTRLLVAQRPVTVLVMDLHDFTGLSQRLDNNTLSNLLAEFGRRTSRILLERNAWSFKTIGDAVMAVWAHDSLMAAAEQIFDSLTAAIEMSNEIRQLGREFGLDRDLLVGVGMSTGEASLGGLGAQGKVDVIGDTVNLAFRLEAATRKLDNDLLVSEATRYVLGAAPAEMFTERTVELKGFDQPVRAFGMKLEQIQAWLQRTSGDTLQEE